MNLDSINSLSPELQEKWQKLLALLQSLDSVVVALSGGVDSGLLSTAAYLTLGEHMLAATVHSLVNVPGEVEAAQTLAHKVGFPHRIIEFNELEIPRFVKNPPDRCYHCKLARFTALTKLARQEGITYILEGTNADDRGDYRPGMRAVTELGILSPLLEVGLTKEEIRLLSHALGLSVWNRPSSPCLATRFPYGVKITTSALAQVAQAEEFLREYGFQPVRVRYLGDTARIEVEPAEIGRLAEMRMPTVAFLKQIGFRFISVDLQGFRSGSLNEGLTK
jgi:uncharacterized protein